RHVGRGSSCAMDLAPPPCIPPHRVVAAVEPARLQLLEQSDQRQLLARRLGRIGRQQLIENRYPWPKLRPWLHFATIREGGLSRAQNLAHRIPRDLQVPRDLLDRFAFEEMFPPYSANRLHRQHLPSARFESKRAAQQACVWGVKVGRRSPGSGGQSCMPNYICRTLDFPHYGHFRSTT